MIFVIKETLINPGTGASEELNLFIGQFLDNNYVGLENALYSQEIFNALNQHTKAKIFKSTDFASALICVSDISDAVNVASFYNFIKKTMASNPEKFQQAQETVIINLASQMHAGLPDSSLENCKLVIYSIIKFIDFITSDRKTCGSGLGAASYLAGYESQTESYIESQHETEMITTNKMESCTDKVMLRLPTRTELLSEEVSYSEILPKRSNVCIPYEYPAADTIMYNEVSSGIPKSYYPMIEGTSANNTLPIQDNEKEFYDLLVKWIKDNVEEAYGKELADEDVVIDKHTLDFLEHLLIRVYYWHWAHSSAVPKILDVDDEDDEIENSQSSYEFSIKANQDSDIVVNGYSLLLNFVKEAAMKLDYKVYAEAIVRLMRWGTRKQTSLVFADFPYEFDLALGRRVTYNGEISDYQKLTDASGNATIPAAAIMFDVPLADKRLQKIFGRPITMYPVPVGLRFVEQYVHKDTQKKIVLQRYLSLIDVVMELLRKKSGRPHNFDFVGLDLDDAGNIIMTQDIKYPERRELYKQLKDYYEKSKNSLLAAPFFSKGCEDVFLELGSVNTNTKEYNFFSVMERFMQDSNAVNVLQSQTFKTREELADKFENAVIMSTDTAICANLFKQYVVILGRVLTSVTNSTAKDFCAILNLFKDALVKLDYKGDSTFLPETKCRRDSATEMYQEIIGVKETKDSPTISKTAMAENLSEEAADKDATSIVTTKEQVNPATPLDTIDAFAAVSKETEPVKEEKVESNSEESTEPVGEEKIKSNSEESTEPVGEEKVEPKLDFAKDEASAEPIYEKTTSTKEDMIESQKITEKEVVREVEVVKEIKVPMTGAEFINTEFIDSQAVSRITATNVVCGGANGTIYCYFIVESINGDKVLTILEHNTVKTKGITTKQFVELNTLKQWFFRQFIRIADNKPAKVRFESLKAMYDFLGVCVKVD